MAIKGHDAGDPSGALTYVTYHLYLCVLYLFQIQKGLYVEFLGPLLSYPSFLTHQAIAEQVPIIFTHGVRPSVRHKNEKSMILFVYLQFPVYVVILGMFEKSLYVPTIYKLFLPKLFRVHYQAHAKLSAYTEEAIC